MNSPNDAPKSVLIVEDEHLTGVLRHALALVDVRVIDHVTVGRLRAVSMAERGML